MRNRVEDRQHGFYPFIIIENIAIDIHTLTSMDARDKTKEEADQIWSQTRCQSLFNGFILSPSPYSWNIFFCDYSGTLFGHGKKCQSNNNNKKQENKSIYLVINVAVLVLVTLRRHVLLALVGPSFLAVVQIGAVGVQRRLQVSQQGICNNKNMKSEKS